jgi:hypothetical protein
MARVTCETGEPSLAQADRGAPVTDAPATLADGAASGESGVSPWGVATDFRGWADITQRGLSGFHGCKSVSRSPGDDSSAL